MFEPAQANWNRAASSNHSVLAPSLPVARLPARPIFPLAQPAFAGGISSHAVSPHPAGGGGPLASPPPPGSTGFVSPAAFSLMPLGCRLLGPAPSTIRPPFCSLDRRPPPTKPPAFSCLPSPLSSFGPVGSAALEGARVRPWWAPAPHSAHRKSAGRSARTYHGKPGPSPKAREPSEPASCPDGGTYSPCGASSGARYHYCHPSPRLRIIPSQLCRRASRARAPGPRFGGIVVWNCPWPPGISGART